MGPGIRAGSYILQRYSNCVHKRSQQCLLYGSASSDPNLTAAQSAKKAYSATVQVAIRTHQQTSEKIVNFSL